MRRNEALGPLHRFCVDPRQVDEVNRVVERKNPSCESPNGAARDRGDGDPSIECVRTHRLVGGRSKTGRQARIRSIGDRLRTLSQVLSSR
ncbi:MAG: hypothetical protein HYR85_13495 [Planctomycetes bacterium]|nr:hypothetical protein [Planctomycetota bacterium]